MPEPEQIRDEVLNIIGSLELQALRDDAEMAIGWAVLTIDLENGRMHLNGGFDTEMEATVWADENTAGLNRGADPGGLGWTAQVLPVLPRD